MTLCASISRRASVPFSPSCPDRGTPEPMAEIILAARLEAQAQMPGQVIMTSTGSNDRQDQTKQH
jgi:hypothetical protein